MSDLPESIGTAWMQSDGTIVLRLRAVSGTLAVGDAELQYSPGDPDFTAILDHVGPLEPGREVEVAPWPGYE